MAQKWYFLPKQNPAALVRAVAARFCAQEKSLVSVLSSYQPSKFMRNAVSYIHSNSAPRIRTLRRCGGRLSQPALPPHRSLRFQRIARRPLHPALTSSNLRVMPQTTPFPAALRHSWFCILLSNSLTAGWEIFPCAYPHTNFLAFPNLCAMPQAQPTSIPCRRSSRLPVP